MTNPTRTVNLDSDAEIKAWFEELLLTKAILHPHDYRNFLHNDRVYGVLSNDLHLKHAWLRMFREQERKLGNQNNLLILKIRQRVRTARHRKNVKDGLFRLPPGRPPEKIMISIKINKKTIQDDYLWSKLNGDRITVYFKGNKMPVVLSPVLSKEFISFLEHGIGVPTKHFRYIPTSVQYHRKIRLKAVLDVLKKDRDSYPQT